MNSIGVIGAGVMGTDIALLIAESGYSVIVYDNNPDKVEASEENINNRLIRYAGENRISIDDKDEILDRISYSKNIEKLSSVDMVIENVTEDIAVKREVFKQLDEICAPGTILMSNTSSISITEIARATKRPESVIGVHFLIPARSIKIVEIITGASTATETFEMAKDVIKQMGREYIKSKDYPGFIVNRIFMPLINEAAFLLYEGNGTVESIDKIMTHGLGMPKGPFAVADMIGLDNVLAIMEQMYSGYNDTKFRPCPLIKQYVAAGWLGKKRGRGFYRY